MLWRVRTTLPDRPGTLAELANECGEAGVNILGMQIFPGADDVTDEFVLRTPDDWGVPEITKLMQSTGGYGVVVQPATEAALVDQPTRYVQAARTILERPMSFPEVVAQLFDAEADPSPGEEAMRDIMELSVGDSQFEIHRTAPFTPIERARGTAIADLINDVMQRSREAAAVGGAAPARRLGTESETQYSVNGSTVTAMLDGVAVGFATVHDAVAEDDGDVRLIELRVDPAWQRRGIGTRLLMDGARLARMMGASEVLLRSRSDNQAVLPTVLAAGLRGRIRMASDELTVRVPVGDLKPLVR